MLFVQQQLPRWLGEREIDGDYHGWGRGTFRGFDAASVIRLGEPRTASLFPQVEDGGHLKRRKEMVRNMKDSCYELSLRDLVEVSRKIG
ncbi:hypothetical protein SAY87_014242 [Trapa incisa]|uniref:Uncharacterized protein n=1 Tax=Trapa incisa TaxID=236973 RepID=A0AAN7GJN4_9MYRT|nr:hypothetical protein SAY87_014242 [Trapa incisa]